MATSISGPQLVIQHPLWNSELMKALSQLQLQGSLCDATLDCCDGVAVYAHSAVLAAASRRMLSLLSGDNQGLYTLRMKNTTSSTWRLVLRFLYDGCVVLSPSDVKSVRDTAVRFEIRRLIEALSPVASTASVTDTVAVDVIDLDPDNDSTVQPALPANDSNNLMAHTAMQLDTATTDVIVVLDDGDDDTDDALADALQYANNVEASPTQTVSRNRNVNCEELTVIGGNLDTVHTSIVNQSSVVPDIRSNCTASLKTSLPGDATVNRHSQCQYSNSLPVTKFSNSSLTATELETNFICQSAAVSSTVAKSDKIVLQIQPNMSAISSCDDVNASSSLAAGDGLNQSLGSQHSSKRRLNFGHCEEDSASSSGLSMRFLQTGTGDSNSSALRCIAPNFTANSQTVNSIRCPLVCPTTTSRLPTMLTRAPGVRLNPPAAFGSQPSAFRATMTSSQPCQPPVCVVDQNPATSNFLVQMDMCNSVLNLSKTAMFPLPRSQLPVLISNCPSAPEPTVAASCRYNDIISSEGIQTVTTATSQSVAVRSHAMDTIANSCKHSVADVATSSASSPSSAELQAVFPFPSGVGAVLPADVIDSKTMLSVNFVSSSSPVKSFSCTVANGCVMSPLSRSTEIGTVTVICGTAPDTKLPISTLLTQSSRRTVPVVLSSPVVFPQRLSVRSKMPICSPVRTPQITPQQNSLQWQLPAPLSSTVPCHRRQTAIRSKAPIHNVSAVVPSSKPASKASTHSQSPIMPLLQPAVVQQKLADLESVVIPTLLPRPEVTNSACKQAPSIKRRKGCRSRHPKCSTTKSINSSDESDSMPNADIAGDMDEMPPILSRVMAQGDNSSNSISTPPKRSSDSSILDGSSSSARKKLLILTADDLSGCPIAELVKTPSFKSKGTTGSQQSSKCPARKKPGRPRKAVKQGLKAKKQDADVSSVRKEHIRFLGRRIHHEWIIVQETGERKWYQGEVIELISGVDGEPGCRYRIHYDDEDAEYEIDHLVEDYQEGSVIVI